MNTVLASPPLNPSATPFFPGAGGFNKEDGARGLGSLLQRHNSHEQVKASSSTLSFSLNDYHSPAELSRHAPGIVQLDGERPFAIVQRNRLREASMSAIPEVYADVYPTITECARERANNTPSVATEPSSRTSSFTSIRNHVISSSPASSLGSGGVFISDGDLAATFDAQLRNSALFRDVLDRLDIHERAIGQVQHVAQDIDRKVNILVDRAGAQVTQAAVNSPPKFSDPFASSARPSFSVPQPSGFTEHRGSIVGNIPPNQPAPQDDISAISHRLNSLTTSVDWLLAIQTQHAPNGAVLSQSPQPNDLLAMRGMLPLQPAAGLGIPGCTGPRLPVPRTRTWSTGNLDIMRSSKQLTGPLGRVDNGMRDKRRSVSGLLRRDSMATIDSASSASTRDGGPVISKWDQLPLAPELLHSLSNFGVGPPNKIQQRALPFLLRGSNIIAQAPPTQERIAAYVIPAIHIAVTYGANRGQMHGPLVIMIFATVDQATQAQRMIRDLGGPIGVRSALGVGMTSAGSDLTPELRLLHQNMPHIICGTPQKLHALFTSPGGISGSEVRFLVLDEVDQLIARNLQDFVFKIVKLLPAPCSQPLNACSISLNSNGTSPPLYNVFEGNGSTSSLNAPFLNQRRLSTIGTSPPTDIPNGTPQPIDRQTALFSNTVPQDILNLANAIQLREPVRVLVRRDGNVTSTETGQNARGLRQFYLYLAFTAGAGRSDASLPQGSTGIIGSGRGVTSTAETQQAREWKLDALADLFDDVDLTHAIIHVGGLTSLESVVYKLASRGLEVVPLSNEMNTGTRLAALNKFRNPSAGMIRQPAVKVLVLYDVVVKSGDVPQVPLVINYDLPKAVEEYAHRVNPAIAMGYSRPGVVVNFVTATGGDVEMLRSIECFYKIKCPEVPASLQDIL